MPIYEYECQEGHISEKLIPHSANEWEKQEQDCKECGKTAKRIISRGSFQLVGDWYKTTGKY